MNVIALNGETLFEGYMINGILQELKLDVPNEFEQILID